MFENFNETLTNEVVSFEQPGPSCSKHCQLNEVIGQGYVESYSIIVSSVLIFICQKNVRSFCTAKAPRIFFYIKQQCFCKHYIFEKHRLQ